MKIRFGRKALSAVDLRSMFFIINFNVSLPPKENELFPCAPAIGRTNERKKRAPLVGDSERRVEAGCAGKGAEGRRKRMKSVERGEGERGRAGVGGERPFSRWLFWPSEPRKEPSSQKAEEGQEAEKGPGERFKHLWSNYRQRTISYRGSPDTNRGGCSEAEDAVFHERSGTFL